jgi:hypothetical protein
MQTGIRILIAVAPLLLTLLLGWSTVTGDLGWAGAETNSVVTIPLFVWSSVFLLCYLALWRQGFALGRSLALAAGIATQLALLTWIVLFIVSWLLFR